MMQEAKNALCVSSRSTKCLFFIIIILLNVASQLQAPSIQLHHNQHVITHNN